MSSLNEFVFVWVVLVLVGESVMVGTLQVLLSFSFLCFHDWETVSKFGRGKVGYEELKEL